MNPRNRGLKVDEPPAGGVGQPAVLVHGTGRRWPTISSAASQPCSSSVDGLHQRLAEGGKQARKGGRPASFRPPLAVHHDPKLAVAGTRNPSKLDFEIFVSLQICDRNSQVRFPKHMVARGLQKSPVYGQLFNHS
jgi:hypothetical protein